LELHRLASNDSGPAASFPDPIGADMPSSSSSSYATDAAAGAEEVELNRRTVRKLDFILLPFLALLFLFNSLDRSNVGKYFWGGGGFVCAVETCGTR
jgi:hypothetical protein